jgi:hypothetical protein
MTLAANSYGSIADVAGRTPGAYLNTSGTFDTTTMPTLAQVETYIDEISAIMNAALADARFVVPVTQTDAKKAIGAIVNDLAADKTHAKNSSGRFFTERALNSSLSIYEQISREIKSWVEANAQGLENLGATRNPAIDTNTSVRVGVYRITRGVMDDGRTI